MQVPAYASSRPRRSAPFAFIGVGERQTPTPTPSEHLRAVHPPPPLLSAPSSGRGYACAVIMTQPVSAISRSRRPPERLASLCALRGAGLPSQRVSPQRRSLRLALLITVGASCCARVPGGRSTASTTWVRSCSARGGGGAPPASSPPSLWLHPPAPSPPGRPARAAARAPFVETLLRAMAVRRRSSRLRARLAPSTGGSRGLLTARGGDSRRRARRATVGPLLRRRLLLRRTRGLTPADPSTLPWIAGRPLPPRPRHRRCVTSSVASRSRPGVPAFKRRV